MAKRATTVPAKRRPAIVLAPISPEQDRTRRYAALLLRAVRAELPDADYVTREDLIQMRVFQHVSTITRYHEVCLAVKELLRTGKLVTMSRTDLCLPDREERYFKDDEKLADVYRDTITRITRGPLVDATFTVMDVVAIWSSDQHLTLNVKRVAVRAVLKSLLREKRLKSTGEFDYALNS